MKMVKSMFVVMCLVGALSSVSAEEAVAPQADINNVTTTFVPAAAGDLDGEFQGLSAEEIAELEAMEAEAEINDSVNEGQAATTFVE